MGMYIGITVIGIIAVFTGNLLFTEYQSYKFEKEIEKLEEEQEKKKWQKQRNMLWRMLSLVNL
ncbi:hypothetical protein H131_20477 [Lysinibacillus sphaericus OT4b.31]|uniref:Uncharacterized protein n=1 Tax=Lysinibacillus sphaericus OT4b.31 TaxID=1285586 RepID=R7Z906_LYSSH|nr:hypothetical protein H131_20477 [Lysinibacillus sphaericus OT4b.31]